jgi:hypothetical protein
MPMSSHLQVAWEPMLWRLNVRSDRLGDTYFIWLPWLGTPRRGWEHVALSAGEES